jgi:GLPGLI family protein
MKKSLLVISISLIVSALFFSCSPNANPKFISEGIIEYKASPVDPDNAMAALAPSKMTMKFKENFMEAEMTAGMGLFATSFISDPAKKQFIQLVKLINQKFALVIGGDSVKKEVDADPKPIIEMTNDKKLIAGYNCTRAKITYADKSLAGFDVWYTKELNIQNPNWSTPFHDIDGVLLEYQLKRYGLELRFTCTSVSKASIDESLFQLPSDYKIITSKEMAKKFEGF